MADRLTGQVIDWLAEALARLTDYGSMHRCRGSCASHGERVRQ